MGDMLEYNLNAPPPDISDSSTWLWVGNILNELVQTDKAPAYYRNSQLSPQTPGANNIVNFQLTAQSVQYQFGVVVDDNNDMYINSITRAEAISGGFGRAVASSFPVMDRDFVLNGLRNDYGAFRVNMNHVRTSGATETESVLIHLRTGYKEFGIIRPFNTYPNWDPIQRALAYTLSIRELAGLGLTGVTDRSDTAIRGTSGSNSLRTTIGFNIYTRAPLPFDTNNIVNKSGAINQAWQSFNQRAGNNLYQSRLRLISNIAGTAGYQGYACQIIGLFAADDVWSSSFPRPANLTTATASGTDWCIY